LRSPRKGSLEVKMMHAISRRIKRLENLEIEQREESGPDLMTIIMERRRKRAIAEGREPEPYRLPERFPDRFLDSRGRPISVADVMLQQRKRRLLQESIESSGS
jgi:hypothetical protein